jgi:hypothetical protein
VGQALVLEEVRQGCQAGQPGQLLVNRTMSSWLL